jgi:drug/metabolite transporter (DMT)-like permease
MHLIACIVASLCASSKDLISKKISQSNTSTASAFGSFVFALPYYLLALAISWLAGYESFSVSLGFFGFVALRSITDAVAEWSKMASLSHGDISLVASFLSLSPLFLLITSPLITGDPITLSGVISILLIVSGGLLLIGKKGSATGISWKAIGLAVLASVFFSLNSCFDRLAVREASPLLSGFGMTLMAGLMLLPMAVREAGSLKVAFAQPKLFWSRGFFELSFMTLKLYALQAIQAPYVVGILKIGVVFSILGGRVVFKEEHFKRRLIAGLLVCSGVVGILLEVLEK